MSSDVEISDSDLKTDQPGLIRPVPAVQLAVTEAAHVGAPLRGAGQDALSAGVTQPIA